MKTIGEIPPEPAKLRAGYWWWRISPEYSWVCSFQREDFKPILREYRPWNDPPPEVTGKAEPIGHFTCCACEKTFPMMSRSAHVATICTGCYVSDKHPPTFEEWCEANVCEWEMHSPNWYYTPSDKLRHLPIEVFKELSGYDYGTSSKRSYKSSEQANAALKAALLKLGRIRP